MLATREGFHGLQEPLREILSTELEKAGLLDRSHLMSAFLRSKLNQLLVLARSEAGYWLRRSLEDVENSHVPSIPINPSHPPRGGQP